MSKKCGQPVSNNNGEKRRNYCYYFRRIASIFRLKTFPPTSLLYFVQVCLLQKSLPPSPPPFQAGVSSRGGRGRLLQAVLWGVWYYVVLALERGRACVCVYGAPQTDRRWSISLPPSSLFLSLVPTSPMAVEASHLLFRTEICISVSARRGERKDV